MQLMIHMSEQQRMCTRELVWKPGIPMFKNEPQQVLLQPAKYLSVAMLTSVRADWDPVSCLYAMLRKMLAEVFSAHISREVQSWPLTS